MLLQGYRFRASLVAASATTVQFSASANLARIPIILAKDARIAVLTALPSAVTISGGAGIKYVYADLAVPSGDPWSTILGTLTAAPPFDKANLATLFRLLFPDDATIAYAAQDSGATLVMSATAPDSEATTGRIPLGWVRWDGAAIQEVTSYGGAPEASALATSQVPRSYLAGLGLANNGADAANDIDIAVGQCRDSTDVETLTLSAALTKRLDAAWAVGTGNGGLDTGAKGASTWYHLWLIKRADTGLVDALFSTSATAPTMPTNYDRKRRIGAVLTSGASAILAFSQLGDEFLWLAPILDLSGDATEAATSRTLSTPLGVKTIAKFNAGFDVTAANVVVLFSELDVTDAAPSSSAAPLAQYQSNSATGAVFGPVFIRTNTSSQIRSRTTGTLDGTGLSIATLGWMDRRGRDE